MITVHRTRFVTFGAGRDHHHRVPATWSLAPVVDALQALRGAGLIGAVTITAEIGDLRRSAWCINQACFGCQRADPASPHIGVCVDYLFGSWDEARNPNLAARLGFTHPMSHELPPAGWRVL